MEELYIIIPVYNEEASIKKVVNEWITELDGWLDNFKLLVINDGSTDKTVSILERLLTRYDGRLEILSKENAGHGQACMTGYSVAAQRGIEYVLQIDSDGQCDPQYFHRLWRLRNEYEVIYGVRVRRDDGWRRLVASMVLRIYLLVFFRQWCLDSNVPYRLMSVSAITPFLSRIPPTFNLANIALAVLLEASGKLRTGYVPIRFRERYGGEPKVTVSLFGKRAKELYEQLRELLRTQAS